MNITDPIYSDENKARAHLEKLQWPNGPVCPHCGSVDNATKLKGKSTRPGVYKCKSKGCRKPFSVTVGSLMHRSKIPLNKWLAAMHLMTSSKKGVSAHQLHRMLGITYESAWFLAHRLRAAMRDPNAGPIGGSNKVVEADETFIGGKAKNRAFKEPPKKEAVVALVERDGEVRSFHVANVTAKTLRTAIVTAADRASYLMTDENKAYVKFGREFGGHGTVNHSRDEYVRATFWHTNTVENYFSILKRGVFGVYHHVSEAHLHRYLAEFDFRHNTHKLDDTSRAEKALRGMVGKRLTYRRTSDATHT